MPLLSDEEVGLVASTQTLSDSDVGLTDSLGDTITPENYGRVAAARIAKARAERRAKDGSDLSQNEQAAIMDAYREVAGLPMLSNVDSFKEAQKHIVEHQGFILNLARSTSAAFENTAVNYVSEVVDIVKPGWGTKTRRDIAAMNPFDPTKWSGKAGVVIAAMPTLLAGGGIPQAAVLFGLGSFTEGLATAEDTGVTGWKKWGGSATQGAITAASIWLGGKLAQTFTKSLASRIPRLQALLVKGETATVRQIIASEAVRAGISLPPMAVAMVAGTIADNLTAKQTLDPHRKWNDGLEETALNVAAITISNHIVQGAQRIASRPRPLPPGLDIEAAGETIFRPRPPTRTGIEEAPEGPTGFYPSEAGGQEIPVLPHRPEGAIVVPFLEPPVPPEQQVFPVPRPSVETPWRGIGQPMYPRGTPFAYPWEGMGQPVYPKGTIFGNPWEGIGSPVAPKIKPEIQETIKAAAEAIEAAETGTPFKFRRDENGILRKVERSVLSANVPAQGGLATFPEEIVVPALPQPASVISRESQIHPEPEGYAITTPHVNYNTADRYSPARGGTELGPSLTAGENLWVRPAAEARNDRRVLLVQFSNELIKANRSRTSADDYYDKLYSQRPGYTRPSDFWELPQWIGVAARNLPNSDVYVVRNLAEARTFLEKAGYGEIAFSALDVNSKMIQELIAGYTGKVALGGYTDMAPFKGQKNVTVYTAMPDWIKTQGRAFQEGTDYRHFRGTETQPRLQLSTGCLHKCGFCTIPKQIVKSTPKDVAEQVRSFGDLKYKLVYLNDKTFGQADNYTDLVKINQEMKAQNPEFEGFIIQTTAAQMVKFSPEFLHDSGIKYVELGVETYNDPLLKELHKPVSEKLIDQAAEIIRRNGMRLIPNVIVGLPGETPETYARTLGFLEKNSDIISHVNVNNIATYVGTELTQKVGGKSETDQNVVKRAFHTPEQATAAQAFYDAASAFGSKALDAPVAPKAPASPAGEVVLPAAEPLPDVISDNRGAMPMAAMGHAVAQVISPIARLVNDVTGEMAVAVYHLMPGRVLVRRLDWVGNKTNSLVGKIDNIAAEAYKQTTRQDKKWMTATDALGYSNFQRTIEDTPSGRLQAPNARIQGMADAYRNMLDATGLEAVRVKVQAIAPDGSVIDFRQAQTGRYLRNLTPDAFMAIHQGSGTLFDAIAGTIARDNGVSITQAGEFLRQWLGPEAVRKVGQLERLRAIKFLPVTVDVGREKVAIQESDPYRAIIDNARRQARRVYFIEAFGQNIKGQPTLIEKLRADFSKEGGRVEDFDDIIEVFEGRPYKRVFADPRGLLPRSLRVMNTLIATSQTSLSAIPNLPQTMILVPKYVGVRRYLEAVATVLAHPRQTAAQLTAMGAMNRAIIDWTLRPGHGPEDFARLIGSVTARVTGLEAISQFNNMVAGEGFRRLAETWRHGGIKAGDLAVARDLRLTRGEINSINSGAMSQPLYEKIVQNGVAITQFITEQPHRMSRFQHIPILNGLFAYNNYAIGTAKSVLRTARETALALWSGDPRQMGAAAYRIILLTAGIGAGTMSLFLRRAAKNQALIQPGEDVEAILKKSLWEVAFLGPTQRMADAYSFGGGTTEKAMVNLSPKLTAIAQIINTLAGRGRWGELPIEERTVKGVTQVNPLLRGLNNWYVRVQHPQTELYNRTRSMAAAYRPREKAPSDVTVNPRFYHIHQAILEEDDQKLQATVMEYQTWAAAQGQDEETTRRNLRSALSARRPVNFNLADYREFLASLSPEKQAIVKSAQAHYAEITDRLTLPAEEQMARSGDIAGLRKAVQAGQIGAPRARTALERAKETPLERQLGGLDLSAALRVWATASVEERAAIKESMLDKARAVIRNRPADRQLVLDRLKTAGVIK